MIDPSMLKLFDRVEATYQPPANELSKENLDVVGQRAVFQVAHRWSATDGNRYAGQWAMMPVFPTRTRFPFQFCPHSHLVDLERINKP